jgi:hypothetical protein
MKTQVIVGSTLLLTAVAAGMLLKSTAPSSVRPRHRWDYLQKGAVAGVAWTSLEDEAPPKETGRPASYSIHMSKPLDFVYRLPKATTKAEPFLVTPDGLEIPLPENARFADPTYRSVQPVRRYPPDLGHFDVVIRAKGMPSSRFRLRDLPRTRYAFPVNGPEVRTQTVAGIRCEAVAWFPDLPKGSLPAIATAMRLPDGPPKGGPWTWREVRVDLPFVGSAERSTSYSSMSTQATAPYAAVGQVESHPWASTMPRVRITARLSHILQMEDEVDFGEVEVVPSDGLSKNDFQLRLTGPRVARSARGLTLRLEPVTFDRTSYPDFSSPMLHLRVFVQKGSETAGFSPAGGAAKGERRVDVWIGSKFRSQSLPDAAPAQRGGTTAVLEWPNLRPGRRHLRLHVRRSVADRQYAFDLRPNVRRDEGLTSRRRRWKTTTPTLMSFIPTPADFPPRPAAIQRSRLTHP